jgi:hypothetical protein
MTKLGTYHAKALASLVMSLASFENARSVVGLSESPLFHHQYSSIADAINGVCVKESDYESVSKMLLCFCMQYYAVPMDNIYRFNSDSSTILKLFSPTLKDRSQVHIPNNVIASNKPLSVGYRTSAITLSESDGWQLPLAVKRINLDQTATECLMGQLSGLFDDKSLPFQEADLVINRLDRGFGNAQYLCPSYQHGNLVSAVRLRQGQKIYLPASESNTGGRPNIYDKIPRYLYQESQTKTIKYKDTFRDVFQSSIFEIAPTQVGQVEIITKKGRNITHTITQWDNLLLRTKKGKKMSDKPLNLLAVVSIDTESGKNIFKQPLFMVVSGKNKDQLSPQDAFCEYMQRYSIEPFFRFNKQKLLLDKFQSPDIQHLDNWILVVQLAIFLLFLTAYEVQHTCPKWQKYLPIEKEPFKVRLTIAQARKAAQTLFLTFDKNPFLPVKSKKGKPREKGQTQNKRTWYEVIKKKKKPPV